MFHSRAQYSPLRCNGLEEKVQKIGNKNGPWHKTFQVYVFWVSLGQKSLRTTDLEGILLSVSGLNGLTNEVQ